MLLCIPIPLVRAGGFKHDEMIIDVPRAEIPLVRAGGFKQ